MQYTIQQTNAMIYLILVVLSLLLLCFFNAFVVGSAFNNVIFVLHVKSHFSFGIARALKKKPVRNGGICTLKRTMSVRKQRGEKDLLTCGSDHISSRGAQARGCPIASFMRPLPVLRQVAGNGQY